MTNDLHHYMIRSTTEKDDETGEALYYAFDDGWVDRSTADRFNEHEHKTVRLPGGGEWERIEGKMPRYKVCCPDCGSENMTRDGLLSWCEVTQQWEMSSELDAMSCQDCGEETYSAARVWLTPEEESECDRIVEQSKAHIIVEVEDGVVSEVSHVDGTPACEVLILDRDVQETDDKVSVYRFPYQGEPKVTREDYERLERYGAEWEHASDEERAAMMLKEGIAP